MKKKRLNVFACFTAFMSLLAACPVPDDPGKVPDDPPPEILPDLEPKIAIFQEDRTVFNGGVIDTFTGTAPGSRAVISFSIKNIGEATLDLAEAETLRIHGTDAALFAVDLPPGSLHLLPAESTSFAIAFTPDVMGIRTARLSIFSNDPTHGEFQFTMANVPWRGHMIAGGWSHSVAVTYSGEVWTWGNNDFGQLGDGTNTSRTEPGKVPGLADVVSVAAGGEHTLALRSDGTVWAWGHNFSGAIGDGTSETRTSPVHVTGVSSVIAIAAGGHHSVALKSDGTVWTWGFNAETTPASVGLNGITAIASGGGFFTLALGSDRTVWAWGLNEHGQLGDGTTVTRSAPVPVSGLTDVCTIAAGQYHSAAVKTDTTVWVWGQPDGQSTPRQVVGIAQVAAVSGGRVPMALRDDGTVWRLDVWCESTSIVDGLSGIVAITGGEDHWIALRSDGSLFAWGDDASGQLGSGNRGYFSEPVQVDEISGVTAIVAGENHSLAIDTIGKVWAWGSNRIGQLGIGTFDHGPGMRGFSTPQTVAGSIDASNIGAGWEFSFAPELDGDCWAWGSTPFGISSAPELREQLSNLRSATASMWGMGIELVMLKSDGTLWYHCSSVQNGQVAGLADIVSLDGYNGHRVLKTDGTIWKWEYGLDPAQVQGIAGIVSMAVGSGHAVAATDEGSVWAWGMNDAGQVGDGTTVFRASPVQVTGISNVVQVAAGSRYCIALKSDGTVWAWGGNDTGSIGDGTTIDRTTPVHVSQLTGVTAISACSYGMHSLALDTNGNVWAWGRNSYGQIGCGVSLYLETPAAVFGLVLW